jgi:hypothetical protein
MDCTVYVKKIHLGLQENKCILSKAYVIHNFFSHKYIFAGMFLLTLTFLPHTLYRTWVCGCTQTRKFRWEEFSFN